MLSSSRADHVFADQFEALGDGSYVYRHNRRGAAKRVSSSERTAFIGSVRPMWQSGQGDASGRR